MKISCIPICLFQDIQSGALTLTGWFDLAAQFGLDGIEMYDQFLKSFEPDYLKKVASEVRDRGLQISMFTGYGNLAQPSGMVATAGALDRRAQAIAEVKRNVDASLILGTHIVRVVGGSWPANVDRDTVLSSVAAGLRECVVYASPRGVSLALEDHPQVGTKIQDFMEILQRAGTAALKVNLDTSNPMVAGDDPVELTKLVKDRTIHVHVSDRLANLKHTETGTGVVDFPAIFRILKSAGFNGWLSVEAGGKRGAEGVAQGIEYVRRTWAAV